MDSTMYQQFYLVYLTYNEIERLISMCSVTPVDNQAITTIRYCLKSYYMFFYITLLTECVQVHDNYK